MSGRGYAERNLPSFFANSFDLLDHFKVDCKAEELAQGLHLVSLMKDTDLEKGSPASGVPRVYYEPSTTFTSEVRLLSVQFQTRQNNRTQPKTVRRDTKSLSSSEIFRNYF